MNADYMSNDFLFCLPFTVFLNWASLCCMYKALMFNPRDRESFLKFFWYLLVSLRNKFTPTCKLAFNLFKPFQTLNGHNFASGFDKLTFKVSNLYKKISFLFLMSAFQTSKMFLALYSTLWLMALGSKWPKFLNTHLLKKFFIATYPILNLFLYLSIWIS
jgi:hypothetical protein